MKQCPFCKAELEDHARFCLYCMTSLVDKSIAPPIKKHRRFYWIGAAAAALLLIVAIGFSGSQKARQAGSSELSGGSNSYIPTTITPVTTIPGDGPVILETTPKQEPEPVLAGDDTAPDIPASVPPQQPHWTEPEPTSPPATNPPVTEPPVTEPSATKPSATEPQVTEPSVTEPPTTEPPASEPISTEPEETNPPETEPEPTEFVQTALPGEEGYVTQHFIDNPNASQAFHIYEMNPYSSTAPWTRMGYGEDYVVPENDVEYYRISNHLRIKNGIYIIPEYTQKGERVVGIGMLFFRYCSVVKLVLPESVQYIWSAALEDSYELAHIYFSGKRLRIHSTALPPVSKRRYQLVIHCPADAKDYGGRYWKDIAGEYGAVWEEWNG